MDQSHLTDLDFADDVALVPGTKPVLQEMTSSLEQAAGKVRLRISTDKTKTMRVNRKTKVQILIGQQTIEDVEEFTYLSSIISSDGDTERDVQCRISKALGVFQRMRQVRSSLSINTAVKIRLYTTIVVPTAIYASETWKVTKRISQKLNVFHQRCLRRIMGISYHDRVTNEEVLQRSGSRRLEEIVTERRMRLAGHILRLPGHRLPKTAMRWTPPKGKRKQGRPQKTWRSTFLEDLKTINIAWEEAEAIVADRICWRTLVAQCIQQRGRN